MGGVTISKDEKKAAPDAVEAIEAAQQTPPAEIDASELSLDTGFPASVQIGSGEYQMSYLVAEAVKDGKITKSTWNNQIARADRKERVQKIIDRIAEEEKTSTAKKAGDTTTEAVDVRVHADRGIGGSFVALGGGERVRVAAASTNGEAQILDDAELAGQGQ